MQLTYKYPESENFYQEHTLLDKCYSLPSNNNLHNSYFKDVVDAITCKDLAMTFYDNLNSSIDRQIPMNKNNRNNLLLWAHNMQLYMLNMLDKCPDNANPKALEYIRDEIFNDTYMTFINDIYKMCGPHIEDTTLEVVLVSDYKYDKIIEKIETKIQFLKEQQLSHTITPEHNQQSEQLQRPRI